MHVGDTTLTYGRPLDRAHHRYMHGDGKGQWVGMRGRRVLIRPHPPADFMCAALWQCRSIVLARCEPLHVAEEPHERETVSPAGT